MNPLISINPHATRQLIFQLTRLFAMFGIALLFLLMIRGIVGFTMSQSVFERQIEDKIPKHVPIKYKLKKEKENSFKNLANDDWLSDFELEVTNISNKPIYFLDLGLHWFVPDSNSRDGRRTGITLSYGRIDFIDFNTRPVSSDEPLLPGQTHVFTIPEKYQKGWKAHRTRAGKPNPSKVELIFMFLNFGDGTGFHRTDALAYPHTKAQISARRCREGPRMTVGAAETPIAFLTNHLFTKSTGRLAAGYLFLKEPAPNG